MPDRRRGRWPRVMLVTDRRRLAAAMGLPLDEWPGLLTAQIEGALAGGVDLVQLREPDLEMRTLIQFLHGLFQNLPESRDRVVINDRIDVAVVAGARGVHLPERSVGTDAAWRLATGPSWVVGRSVHGVDEARKSVSASYLVAGTVHSTESKGHSVQLLGWEGFSQVVEAAGDIPVLAIGGMTEIDVDPLLARGGAGLAAIGWFQPSQNVALASFVQGRAAAVVSLFDSDACGS